MRVCAEIDRSIGPTHRIGGSSVSLQMFVAQNRLAELAQLANLEAPVFPVTATDLLEHSGRRGSPQLGGGAVGRALRVLRRKWVESGCVATSDELLEAWKAMHEC